jgi:hypothetical protein
MVCDSNGSGKFLSGTNAQANVRCGSEANNRAVVCHDEKPFSYMILLCSKLADGTGTRFAAKARALAEHGEGNHPTGGGGVPAEDKVDPLESHGPYPSAGKVAGPPPIWRWGGTRSPNHPRPRSPRLHRRRLLRHRRLREGPGRHRLGAGRPHRARPQPRRLGPRRGRGSPSGRGLWRGGVRNPPPKRAL